MKEYLNHFIKIFYPFRQHKYIFFQSTLFFVVIVPFFFCSNFVQEHRKNPFFYKRATLDRSLYQSLSRNIFVAKMESCWLNATHTHTHHRHYVFILAAYHLAHTHTCKLLLSYARNPDKINRMGKGCGFFSHRYTYIYVFIFRSPLRFYSVTRNSSIHKSV